ncbi:MAG: RNA ligase family protein [Williamsia sp.]|nr:RNA ligase family protein [Williamsia sp.]
MAQSEKYGRTYHYPFSPGTTSDDRINHDYWLDVQRIDKLVHTEKMDGENNCLSRFGVFARSHAAPTASPWTTTIRQYWGQIRRELGELEVFLENCYAIHSLQYRQLDHHFYVFAVREKGIWLSWEETKFYAALLDLPTVPELSITTTPASKSRFEEDLLQLTAGPGRYDPVDAVTGKPASMEGIVSRNMAHYATEAFKNNVFKYVRKGHVKTDEHWTRHWKRAPLIQEGGNYVATD